MTRISLFISVFVLFCLPAFADRPNIVFIITDDQGYGDISAHGNEILKTPNLDRLHSESVRLTDYHVDPTCAPTRAALLTGRDSTRTGVWHTINGRSMMDTAEYTLIEHLKNSGYNTALFGKWHLGDNAPCRPQDQGFDHVVWHKGGGITQGPDYFGNDYFDDTYEVNGEYQKFEGYCTDVWFREAMKYIDEAKDQDKPFLAWIATNAPHGPFLVDEKYSKPYANLGVPGDSANFYGMIANIDENVGKLRAYLQANGLAENTLLIFTTDNGTARGLFQNQDKKRIKGFNAGMRDNKGSEYDGGHRVPFFVHWPAQGLNKGRDMPAFCGHIDVFPTLVDMLGLKPIDQDKLTRGPMDGRSIAAGIAGQPLASAGPRFIHSQRVYDPIKWRKSAVMTERWRLINGKELYDITQDPGQQNDVAGEHPDVVEKLRGEYDAWWDSLKPVFDEVVRYDLGGAENPTTLMSHDWLMEEGNAAWHQNRVRSNALINGPFMVNIVKAGKYRITPMRWPEYVDEPSGCVEASISFEFNHPDPAVPAAMSDGGEVDPEKPVGGFEMNLPAGPATLTTTLTREDGKSFGAYYVKVELIEE